MDAVGRRPGSYSARHDHCRAGQTSVDCEQSMQEAVSREIDSIIQIDRHNVCCSIKTRDLSRERSHSRGKHYTSRLLIRVEIPLIRLAPCLFTVRLDDVLVRPRRQHSLSKWIPLTHPVARYDAVEVPIRYRFHVAFHSPDEIMHTISNPNVLCRDASRTLYLRRDTRRSACGSPCTG